MDPEERHGAESPNRYLLRAMFHTYRPHHDGKKKKPSRRKRGQESSSRLSRCCGQPRTTSFHDQQSDDMNASFETDSAAPLLVESQRKSGKAPQTKELMVAKKMSVKLRLLRTYSLNQQQLPEHRDDWAANPIIIIHKATTTSPKFQEDLTKYQLSTEHALLDLLMVNKNHFLEILKEKDDLQSANSFLLRQTSTKQLRLKKSGSFPAVHSASPRLLTPSMLEHKHMEVWSSPKRSPSRLANSAVQKSDAAPNKRKWIVSIMGGFKGVKQRILKRVLNKGRKKSKRASIGETKIRNWIRLRGRCHHPKAKISSSSRISSPVKREMLQVRRTLSLNESLHRYAPLMDQSSSFGSNGSKWQYRKSQSLRLSNEDQTHQSTENRLKYSFRRRLSLPDLDAIFQAKEQVDTDIHPESGSHDQHEINPSRRISVDRKEPSLDCIDETEALEGSPIAVRTDEERVDEKHNNFVEDQDQEIASSFPSSNDDQKPVGSIPTEEAESFHTMEGVQLKLDDNDDTDFNYVRDVLEVSGFLDQGGCCPGTLWYSLDQPLSPLVFKELECLLQSMEGDSSSSSTHRRLLFDLINEELLGIFESSLTYFPKPLNGQGSQLVPKGRRILEHVWRRIISRRRLLEMDMSLLDIFCRDMKRGDGWMNIQMESEDVTLELGELIMDQLLEEILC